MLAAFYRFPLSFGLSSWTIARYAPAKLSQNLLEKLCKPNANELARFAEAQPNLLKII
jgi:hypothetical protein